MCSWVSGRCSRSPPCGGPSVNSLGDEPRSEGGDGLAVVVIVGLLLVALAALGVAGYFVVQWIAVANAAVTDPDRGDTDHFATPGNEGFETATEFPAELQDLDALTAT